MADCVILASGNGTNARAIATDPRLTNSIAGIISDRRKSPVLFWAKEQGLCAKYVDCRAETRDMADARLLEAVAQTGAALVVLAGFMRILGPRFVEAYPDRIVNIHPSILPHHPGLNAIERSWDAGDGMLGVTIHKVDQGVDSGPILAQAAVNRAHISSLSELYTKIHEIEHAMYPEVVTQLLTGFANNQHHDRSFSANIDGVPILEALPHHAELLYPENADGTESRKL